MMKHSQADKQVWSTHPAGQPLIIILINLATILAPVRPNES